MDSNDNFEHLLSIKTLKTQKNIYSDQENKFQKLSCTNLTPRNVISSVVNKIKTIQLSSCTKNSLSIRRNLPEASCRRLQPVTVFESLKKDTRPVNIGSKFETQDFTATQLEEAIDNAEALQIDKGYMQEFEQPFDNFGDKLKTTEPHLITNEIEENNPKNIACDLEIAINDKEIVNMLDGDQDCAIASKEHETNEAVTKTSVINQKISVEHNYAMVEPEIKPSCSTKHNPIEDTKNITNMTAKKEEITKFKTESENLDSIQPILNKTYCIDNQYTSETIENNLCNEIPINNSKEDDIVINLGIENEEMCINSLTEVMRASNDGYDYNTITNSPILPLTTKIESISSPHMVFNLNDFEIFETMANSVIINNNMDCEHDIINSQILNSKDLSVNLKKKHLSDSELELSQKECSVDYQSLNEDQSCHSNTSLIETERNSLKESLLDPLNENAEVEVVEATNKENCDNHCPNEHFDVKPLDNKGLDILKSIENEKPKEFLEDDILFSSDEEEDYINKQSLELPLTCALETSFYTNKSDVLDKNMFVGFQTASNRSISVNSDSFSKAQSLMDDVDCNLGPSLMELVDRCEKSANELTINDPFNNKDHDLSANQSEHAIEHKSTIETENPKIKRAFKSDPHEQFVGFKTASNKNIVLTEKAQQRVLKVFQDIDMSENFAESHKESKDNILFDNDLDADCFDENILLDNQAPNLNSKDLISNKNKRKIKNEELTEAIVDSKTNAKIVNDLSLNKDGQQGMFQGFKTASNKVIKVSDKALAKSKSLFQNIDSDDVLESKIKDTQDNDLDLSKINDCHVFKKPESPIARNNKFNGFKTASDKEIRVSAAALKKSKNVFENIDVDRSFHQDVYNEDSKKIMEDLPKDAVYCGFKTASNKQISISEKSLKQTKDIFNFNDDEKGQEAYKSDSIPINVGFKTASNKPVKLSKEALEKSKRIFDTVCNKADEISDDCKNTKDIQSSIKENIECFDDNCKFSGFNTANNEAVKVSDQALKEFKSSLELKFNNLDEQICGFKTASNKAVKISADALKKSKNLFEAINYIDDIICDSEGSDKNSNSIPFNDGINPEPSNLSKKFQGFRTASNKQVTISEEAIVKTKDLFNDIQLLNELENPNIQEHCFNGFKTASEKKIGVSKEAIHKSKALFEEFNNIEADKLTCNTKPLFTGFQTGSNKTIKVSEKALERTKSIFDNLDPIPNQTKDDNLTKVIKNNDKIDINKPKGFCFQNANNRDVKIAQKSIDHIIKSTVNSSKDLNNIVDKAVPSIDKFLDTQAVHNFETTLYTEDFCKETPIKTKRCASPILSCPKAKRKKPFQTPYKTDISEPKAKETVINTIKSNVKFNFKENYKKNKMIDLKFLQQLEKESEDIINTDKYITKFTFNNILDFKFKNERNDLPIELKTDVLTINDIKTIFEDSTNKNIIPDGWIDNHLKLILWKLISYEIKFPKVLHKVCTATNVLDQLKFRYDKEVYNVERSALRKILEKDEVSTRCMVLCVVNVIEDGNVVTSISDMNKTIELTVTDGWYCVKASLDKMLSKLVLDSKIIVGCKLITHGAELLNCDQGKSPLEDISNVRLKLFGNSTRRVRWHTRLGFHATAAILNQLSSVKINGGKVSKLRVFVTRVYPTLYVEKFEDGSTVTRSERLEQLYQNKYETERQNLMEKLYEDVQKELSDEDSQDSGSEVATPGGKRKLLESGSQIAKIMKRSKDPVEFRSTLTSSQVCLLNEYTSKRRDRLQQQIEDRIRLKIDKTGGRSVRNVVSLLKARVVDIRERNGSLDTCKGMISIWRPNDAVSEIIKEGGWIDVLNALPTALKYQEIQITAGRQTVFSKAKPKLTENIVTHTNKLVRECIQIKKLVEKPNGTLEYNEMDTLGLVIEIDPINIDFEKSGRQFQNLYLADVEKNIICVNFWGGIKKFGFENILDTGQFVFGRNLQKRVGNTRKCIPHFRVTEFSTFTKTPRSVTERILLDNFVKSFKNIDKKKFRLECSLIRSHKESSKYNNYTENISPYRINQSDYNLSKNRIFIDSPLAQNINKKDEEIRLTGLDFESTFKQIDTQNISPELLKRKKIAHEKIARLKKYGEPPPLSPIHILNKSKNATNAFKSPLQNNLKESIPVCSPKTTKDVLTIVENRSTSPVFNAPCTKKMFLNPVKLNFNDGNVTDHFAEEFDSSPPLSLD